MWARTGPDVVWQASMDCLRIVFILIQSKVMQLCVSMNSLEIKSDPKGHAIRGVGRAMPTMSDFQRHFIIECLPDGPFYLFYPITFKRKPNRREGFVIVNAKSIFLPLLSFLPSCSFLSERHTITEAFPFSFFWQ